MKKLLPVITILALFQVACTTTETRNELAEKPTQHIKVANVTSMQEAEQIFTKDTEVIRNKSKLDAVEMQQIHYITYTLEKSVAYLAENLQGERQKLAEEIAVVVEDIHIDSENNRREKLEQHLSRYFMLADKMMAGFK